MEAGTQKKLFEDTAQVKTKTYRAIRHDVVRAKQSANCSTVHHPDQKIRQIKNVIQTYGWAGRNDLRILELFAGRGNLTREYEQYGTVDAYDKTHLGTGDSYIEYHRLIAEKRKYDIIDLDPYGFPNRLLPDVFLLIDQGLVFMTMPKPNVNILNGITQTHLTSYYGQPNPTHDTIIERIVLFGLCHWRQVQLLSSIDCQSIWRFALQVDKVKATEYTGVRNR